MLPRHSSGKIIVSDIIKGSSEVLGVKINKYIQLTCEIKDNGKYVIYTTDSRELKPLRLLFADEVRHVIDEGYEYKVGNLRNTLRYLAEAIEELGDKSIGVVK